jgi:hypothetical protein
VDSQAQEAARSLLTPRETPETELVPREAPANIDTSPDSTGTRSTEERTAEAEQIERIPTAKEPQIEASRDHVSKVNSDGLDVQKQEPSRAFAHPDHEIKLAAAKGASSKNIVEGKRARKPAAFYFERIY